MEPCDEFRPRETALVYHLIISTSKLASNNRLYFPLKIHFQMLNLQQTQDVLHDELFPEDSYTGNTYWADLPPRQRLAWVNSQALSEARRELGDFIVEFTHHPLRPFGRYFRRYIVTGLGLFVEGYSLFSVGNLTALFQEVWPQCWKSFVVCNSNWIASVGYLEIVGIIFGQIAVGIIGDWIGRRWGMIQDAVVMLIGTILLGGMWGTNLQGWVIMYAISLMFYSFGVGGEYPMTSTRAIENKDSHTSKTGDKLHRGRNVLLAFSMQGWGQLANQAVLLICLVIFNNAQPPYSETSAQWTFRLSFVLIGLVTLWLLYHRVHKMQFADHALQLSKKRSNVTGYDQQSLRLIGSHYWHRLVGTAGCWFANDFLFYGQKIFQSSFIKTIHPNSTVVELWMLNLINIGCALVGYYMAAVFVDYKLYGRMRMQAIGFVATFIIFIIAASLFPTLQKPGTPVKIFEFLYFFSSFWVQFGPNSTVFLVAAEVYPASVRATAHGLSAATGKVGALIPAILYNYVGDQTRFWIVTAFGFLGFLLTIIFVPDTTGLDLQEQERYWRHVREGRMADYHGIAVHPRHLSLWERAVLHRHRYYDPRQDYIARIEELRNRYRLANSNDGQRRPEEDFDNEISEPVSRYFSLEAEEADVKR